MSILGMGTLEILVILLVAFIVMGPERMFDAARLLGKAVREARRLTESLPDLTLDDDPVRPTESRNVSRGDGPNAGLSEAAADTADPRKADGPARRGDGPIAFEPSPGPAARDKGDGPPQQEKS